MNSSKPIMQLMDEFLENQDIRDTARRRYRENLKMFITWLTTHADDVRNPKRSDVINYKEHLIQSRKAVTTIDAYMVPVRRFFSYLEEEGIHDNIAAGIHSPRRYQGYRKTYLNADQVNDLLRSISRGTKAGKRDYAIINLMVNTGLRCVEVSRMDFNDILIGKNAYILLIQGKGHLDKDRELKVPEMLFVPVLEYLAERTIPDGSNPPMFVNHSYNAKGARFTQLSISKIIKRSLRRMDIDTPKITAHSLRHTAAINAIKAGAKITEVQAMLGHRNSSSTDIYLRALEAESIHEGTAVRLLGDYYKKAQKNNKSGQKRSPGQADGNL